ncbi:MAG: BatD family protein, partial [Bacteroidota bacterium]|nr:BatD family protein [Bacteroidota bacterium]
VGGKTHKSNQLIIQVVAGNSGTQNQSQSKQTQATQNTSQTSGANHFVRLSLNKTTAYQGEAIYGSFKMYLSNRNLAGFKDIKFPEYNGFWVEDVNNPRQIHMKMENYKGKNYYTAELKSIVLFPQRSGKLEISEGNFDIVLQERVNSNQSGSLFDSFFGRVQNVPYTLKSNAITVNIKPLPKQQPSSYIGAVGGFSASTEISHDSIDVNDAFTIKINLQGTGNFNLINAPKLNLPNEFEVYDPEVKKNLSKTANGSTGSINWIYTIIPRYPENYILKPIEISWFNPKTQSYQSYKGQETSIYVNRTADFKEEKAQVSLSGSDIEMMANDIRYIKTIPKKQKKSFIGTWLFWLAYILPFSILVLIVFLRRKQIKERANITKIRNKKANKVARKRLKLAKGLMDEEKPEFYNEIIKALWGYVADKLDMDIANLSRESVTERMHEKQLSENLIKKLVYIIDICEYAHFAPPDEENDPTRIYQYTAGLISKLEQNL